MIDYLLIGICTIGLVLSVIDERESYFCTTGWFTALAGWLTILIF